VTGEAATRVHARRQARRAQIDIAHQDACDKVLNGRARVDDFDATRVDLVRLQDDVAQLGQGIVADRSQENLGRADVGISAIRRLWRREMGNLVAARPFKEWKKSEAIKVRAWKIAGDLAQVTGEDATDASNASPHIVDVRPFVEIEQQLLALHSSLHPA
jgi:5,5'-dehydrodivanillate O-demethylase oxygenase subunit